MNDLLKHFVRYQFPAMLWAIIIFIASSIPAAKLPNFTQTLNDKLIHGTIFFIFGLLVYRALEPRQIAEKIEWSRLLIATSAVIVYGVIDEIHQGFVPGRTVDLLDALADAVGGLLAALVIYLRFSSKSPRRA